MSEFSRAMISPDRRRNAFISASGKIPCATIENVPGPFRRPGELIWLARQMIRLALQMIGLALQTIWLALPTTRLACQTIWLALQMTRRPLQMFSLAPRMIRLAREVISQRREMTASRDEMTSPAPSRPFSCRVRTDFVRTVLSARFARRSDSRDGPHKIRADPTRLRPPRRVPRSCTQGRARATIARTGTTLSTRSRHPAVNVHPLSAEHS